MAKSNVDMAVHRTKNIKYARNEQVFYNVYNYIWYVKKKTKKKKDEAMTYKLKSVLLNNPYSSVWSTVWDLKATGGMLGGTEAVSGIF